MKTKTEDLAPAVARGFLDDDGLTELGRYRAALEYVSEAHRSGKGYAQTVARVRAFLSEEDSKHA